LLKTRIGRPSHAEIRAKAEAKMKAIAEAKAKASYDSVSDAFSADDEGMKESKITKRASSDKESPQKGVGLKNEEHIRREQWHY
jgi:hypothetical protein